MYENDWWTERLPLLRPSAGFKPRKFPLHREKDNLIPQLYVKYDINLEFKAIL